MSYLLSETGVFFLFSVTDFFGLFVRGGCLICYQVFSLLSQTGVIFAGKENG